MKELIGSYWALGAGIVIAYLLGSFSTAVFISKTFKGIDVRDYGSGNAGATNAVRVMGKKYGAFVYIGDALKGIIAVLLGMFLFPQYGGWICGFSCVIGHFFPVFYGFRGGKGVMTTVAVAAVLDWRILIAMAVTFVLMCAIFRMVSLASMAMMLVFAIGAGIANGFVSVPFFTALLLFILIVWRHRSNIKRIMDGTESKIFQKKK